VLRGLVNNLSTVALSIILALFVWFVAIQETNPIVEQPYREPVPVLMLNQPPGTVLTNAPDDSIKVIIRGPLQTLAALQVDDFSAVVDLSTVPLGGAKVGVAVSVGNHLVSVVEQDIDTISIRLEEYRSVQLPITPTLIGEPALGHVAGALLIEPSVVSFQGPASRVDLVSEARIQLSIEGAREWVQARVIVRLWDADGRVVTGVDPDPPEILATVPITKSEQYAELFVTVNLTGTIAAGYRMTDYSVEPQRVTLFGPPGVVADLPGFVSTVPVDVSDARADIVQRVGLLVPRGTTLIDTQNVLVEIDIEPVVTTLTVPWQPRILGPDPGLGVAISPERVSVSLVGPLALMESFDPESDLSLTLNLFGMGVGSYQLALAALSNQLGVEVVGVLPPTVLVEISLLPTPTPTPTPTITPTLIITGTLIPVVPSETGTPIYLPSATPTPTPAP